MNKNLNIYTRSMIIRNIAKNCKRDKAAVREIYEELEKNIADILAKADEDNDVLIKLFDGISVESTYLPEKEKLNNLTGETIITKDRIKPKFNITRTYREKLSLYNK